MANSCVAWKANTRLANAKKGDLFNHDNGFLGGSIKGSLSNSLWFSQLVKGFRCEKRTRKAKPGVISAVLTSSNVKEAVVS